MLRQTSLWLLLVACWGSAADVTFSGCLERAGDQSISIQLADHRVICALLPDAAPLSAAAVAEQYRMGDQVEIRCKPIQPVWEKGTSRYQYLEVTAMRLVDRPSPEKLAQILDAVPFREGENLLARPDSAASVSHKANVLSGPGSQEFERARRVNLDYVANMPNFVADETAKRYRSTRKTPRWTSFDTLETEITFQGHRIIRRQIRRDGKPWDQPFEALPGFKWYGGFGSEIRPLFDPKCPNTVEYQGRAKVGGRQLLEYRFTTPLDGCFGFFYYQYQRFNPARTGHVFVDDPGGNVFQLDEDSRGFPDEFEFAEREEHLFWDYVKIGEETYLLPVRATCLASYFSGTRYRIEVEFKNHRHFESSTNLTFH